MTARVLVTSAGNAPGNNLVRSFRAGPEPVFIDWMSRRPVRPQELYRGQELPDASGGTPAMGPRPGVYSRS